MKGRSFNLQSGVVESTENIYKYHMQVQQNTLKGAKDKLAAVQGINPQPADKVEEELESSAPSSPIEKIDANEVLSAIPKTSETGAQVGAY